MTGIREVAKMAGVSASTVSRVMNGTAKVDEEKKQRVQEAIKKTGFKPNELARALFKQSSKIIGVIVPNIENPFFNEMAKAIEEETFRCGYKLLLCNSNDDEEKEFMNIQMLTQMKADGIVIMTNSVSTGKAIADCDIPVVALDRKVSGGAEIAYVEANNYNGGKLAMEHLIQCGCKNIVYMRGPMELSSGQKRYKGYKEVCNQYQIVEQTIECGYGFENGLEVTGKLLERYPEVDGIITSNDMVAVSVYKVLNSRGYRVPEDIQIIGFDDIRFCRLVTPELTTIHQPITEMGTLAAQIIIDYVQGKDSEKENIFEVSLIERQTTRRKK